MARDYVTIAVLPQTKERFIKRFRAVKKDLPYFYIDNYLNALLDLEEDSVKPREVKA